MAASSTWDFDCVVVGGGPAGLVSALYLRRFCRRVLVLNAGRPRAQRIRRTNNLLGYDKGISGPELLSRLKRQLRRLGVERQKGEARVNILSSGGFEIEGGLSSIRTAKVILATGIRDILPTLPNLEILGRLGFLNYCPLCDAYEHRFKEVGVLVQDEAGLRKALFMRPYTLHLSVLLLRQFRPSAAMLRSLRQAKVRMLSGELEALEQKQGKVVWVCFRDQMPQKFDVLYCELGSTMNDQAFAHWPRLRRGKDGRLWTDSEQRVSVAGAFAAGDCTTSISQISVAAGQAAVAATTVHNELRQERGSKDLNLCLDTHH